MLELGYTGAGRGGEKGEKRGKRKRNRDNSSVVNNQSMRPRNNPEPKENRTSLKKCLASGEWSVENGVECRTRRMEWKRETG